MLAPRGLVEVLEAIERLSPELPWEEVASSVLPVFERAVPPTLPPEAHDQVRLVLPPGVSVGFGVDIGPALMRVTRGLLQEWGQTADALAVRAVFNLRARAGVADPADLVRVPVEDLVVTAYQSGDGWASALLLVPDLLGPRGVRLARRGALHARPERPRPRGVRLLRRPAALRAARRRSGPGVTNTQVGSRSLHI